MNTPSIQDIVDRNVELNGALLKELAIDKKYDHAFEELVLTRAAEYRGEVERGTTGRLWSLHNVGFLP